LGNQVISDVHVRFTTEEMDALRLIGSRRQAPVSAVVRSMTRHFLILWARGEDVVTELGAISWGKQ
jgi:hypothetical protein